MRAERDSGFMTERRMDSHGLPALEPSILPKKKSLRAGSSVLIDKIVDNIEIDILFGEYKPREHLVQDQLAKKYGVGRNVIRAVLQKLEEKSVVEHFAHRGSVVKEFTAKKAKDLYQLRMLLEGIAMEMAASRITSREIRQLKSLSDEMRIHLQKRELMGFVLAHERFHQLIFETAGNFYLSKMIRELISAASSIRYFSYSRYSIRENKKHLLEEHKQLINFLQKGDAQKAGEMAKSHIRSGINHYLKTFFPGESLME
jgi:DNA-binding GntR family transcriptional regulator